MARVEDLSLVVTWIVAVFTDQKDAIDGGYYSDDKARAIVKRWKNDNGD